MGGTRPLDLPDEAEAVHVQPHADETHVTISLLNGDGEFLEDHTYLIPDYDVDGQEVASDD